MRHKGTGLMFLGALLLLAAAGLTGYNLTESGQARESSAKAVEYLAADIAANPPPAESLPGAQQDYIRFPDMEMPVTSIDGQEYLGTLEIPVLELELPVISDWSYEALKLAPCRYQGSAYSGGLILMAHNYESHFGRLRELRPGDSVCFTDISGNLFSYQVEDLEEIPGTDPESMVAGKWDLTLFTCTYGGQKRVTVRCTRTG